jgi:hypothetical protein
MSTDIEQSSQQEATTAPRPAADDYTPLFSVFCIFKIHFNIILLLSLTGNAPMELHGLLRDSFTFYADDVRTSQETHLLVSKISYGESFTFYVDNVRTSQETHLLVFKVLTGRVLRFM